MMICAADFEELFPDLAPAPSPSRSCIARWEDDGGRTLGADPHPAPALPSSAIRRYRRTDPLFAAIFFSAMPAAAVYGATMAVMATSGRLLEG